MRIFLLVFMMLQITSCAVAVKESAVSPVPSLNQPNEWAMNSVPNMSKVEPYFPRKAINDKKNGWCVVSYSVSPDGHTSNHQIVECSPREYFEVAALTQAKQVYYSPAPEVVVDNVKIVFKYQLDGKKF